jgi:hypothetical protein
LGAGIVSVKFDRARLDPQFGWCSGADYFELDRDKLHEEIILSISRFLHVWGSLEALLDLIRLSKDHSRSRKIQFACKYLRDRLSSRYVPYNYRTYNRIFDSCIRNNPCFNNTSKKIRNKSEIGEYGMGLHMVYQIRNSIVHGVFEFQQPPISPFMCSQAEIIDVASRIVLLGIQMILSAYFIKMSFEIDSYEDEEIYRSTEIHDLLKTIHLEMEIS